MNATQEVVSVVVLESPTRRLRLEKIPYGNPRAERFRVLISSRIGEVMACVTVAREAIRVEPRGIAGTPGLVAGETIIPINATDLAVLQDWLGSGRRSAVKAPVLALRA